VTVQHELEERQKLLSGELVHRIKNTLAVAVGIARQTLRGVDPKRERDALTSRLIALSKAQDILIQSSSARASIQMVIEGALAPYRSGAGRIKISGPDLELESKQALSVAIAVHELATNAVKYGALSNDVGTVQICWGFVGGEFTLAWGESGGPRVQEPTTKGFGSRVIQTLLANDFGGSVVLSYETTGFVCRLATATENLTR
jgi:two-component sensor histidine kinase